MIDLTGRRQAGPPAATDGKFTVRWSDVHYPHENSHLEVFQTVEKVGHARRYDDAEPRVAKNPLQSYQFKLLIFLYLCVCPETWLKTLVFGQNCYRKFSGVSG
jgi:hypothetical protein